MSNLNFFNPFTDSNSGGGGGGDTSERVRYTIKKQTDNTSGEVTYKLMQSINNGSQTIAGEIIGFNGSSILVNYGDSGVLLDTALDGKVDKETGKGLSTNDFTTEEKTKLARIESEAQVNVQADWNQTTVTADDYIKNKPVIPDAQIQSDWNQTNTESKDFIKNKPTIPAAQVNADWNAESGVAQILHKPTIPDAQIQSDWNQNDTESKDFIKNKPTLGTASAKNYTTAVSGLSTDLITSAGVNEALSDKVDKVTGKGLSTNDFTNSYKETLDGLSNTLNLKADLIDGKVPASQIPSYVDDTVEGYYYQSAFYEDSTHTTAITGERGKIYIDLTENKTYRWTGTVYARIDECPAFGETQGTIYEGNKGKANADAIGTIANLTTTATDLVDAVNELNSSKVDKNGTDSLMTAAEHTKLSGIESGAEVNVQSDWNQTDTTADDYIKNKPNIPSGIVVDQVYDGTSTNAQSGVAIAGALSDKVDKVTGKGLSTNDFTDAYQTELDGLDTVLDGKVDKETGKGLSTNDFTDAYKTAVDGAAQQATTYTKNETDTLLVDKVDKVTGKGLSTNDYTTEEKDKLAGIASGAEVNVQSDWSQSDSSADDYIKNKPTIPTVNDATLTIQKNGTAVGTFSANAATAATINITVPVDAADVSALPDTTKYGASLSLSINSTTYVVTASLKDQDGNTLGVAQTIDLPLETVVVGGSYDDTTKKVILTLKNGNTIDFSVADLVAGLQTEITSTNKLDADLVDDTTSVHKFVTAADKTAWNAKSDFSGDYDDLMNKPTIPAAQVNADWNATSGVAQILNKPTIPAPMTVDQTYDATSANAQSGVAIEVKKPGLKTTGKQYVIDGQTVTAGTGAEAFNDLDTNKAAGRYSHAEGAYAIASGDYSHAEGQNTTVSGDYSHAEGYFTTASGAYSHAEGAYATASGDLSHAEGYHTKAASDYQHVQGKYNVEDPSSEYAFIIGNGTGDTARHNAFAIGWNGLIYVNGASAGVDVSAFPSPADINAAITKANDAAPQSTTYTKSQIDTLLDGKLDTGAVSSTGTAATGWNNCRLSNGKIQYYNTNTTYSSATTSSSGLMSASDKQKLNGIDTGATKTIVDTALNSTSTNPVQNKAVQAPIAQLVNAGAKNLLEITATSQTINGVTFSVNDDGTITANGTATDRVVFFVNRDVSASILRSGKFTGCPVGGSQNTYVMILEQNNYPYSGIAYDYGSGCDLSYTGSINANCYIQMPSGVTVNNLVFKPMICTTEDYAISPEFVPYAMSNLELTKKVNEFGVKIITVALADRTFTESADGLFYSDKVDLSGIFSELYAATMQNFSNVRNISIQPMINNTVKALYLAVCDPSEPSSLSFTGGSVEFVIFGKLK